MWKVYEYVRVDIVDKDGCVIYPKGSWYLVGDYDTLDAAARVVKNEIYLYNCTCEDNDPNPKFRIENCFE